MSIIGNKDSFAVQVEVTEVVDDWVFGIFVFWLEGKLVGDLDDKSVDLKGCLHWIKEFLSQNINRFEHGLYEMEKSLAFSFLCDSVILKDHQEIPCAKEKYDDIFDRFHISHLGMSSFDDLNLLLIENDEGLQRVLWQQGDLDVDQVFFLRVKLIKFCARLRRF